MRNHITFKPYRFATLRTLVVDNQDVLLLKNEKVVQRICVDELTQLRFGISENDGIYMRLGYFYSIELKPAQGRIFKIKLMSFYRKNMEENVNLINQMLDIIEPIFDLKMKSIWLQIENGLSTEICGITLNQNGIRLSHKRNAQLITWNDLSIKTYTSYFVLISIANPKNYKSFE